MAVKPVAVWPRRQTQTHTHTSCPFRTRPATSSHLPPTSGSRKLVLGTIQLKLLAAAAHDHELRRVHLEPLRGSCRVVGSTAGQARCGPHLGRELGALPTAALHVRCAADDQDVVCDRLGSAGQHLREPGSAAACEDSTARHGGAGQGRKRSQTRTLPPAASTTSFSSRGGGVTCLVT